MWTTRKMHDFQRYFPGLSRTLSFNFQDFPGPRWFSRTFHVLEFSRKKIQDFPGGVGTLSEYTDENASQLGNRKLLPLTTRIPLNWSRWRFTSRTTVASTNFITIGFGDLSAASAWKTRRQDSNVKRRLLLCTRQKYIGAGSYIVSAANTRLAAQVSVNVR